MACFLQYSYERISYWWKCPKDEQVALFITVVWTESHNNLQTVVQYAIEKSERDPFTFRIPLYNEKVNKRSVRFRFRKVMKDDGPSLMVNPGVNPSQIMSWEDKHQRGNADSVKMKYKNFKIIFSLLFLAV